MTIKGISNMTAAEEVLWETRSALRRHFAADPLLEWVLANHELRHTRLCATQKLLTTATRCTCGMAKAWEAHLRGVA